MSRLSHILRMFLKWRIKHISDRRFVLILSLVVGTVVGFLAVALKWMITELVGLMHQDSYSAIKTSFYFGLPMIGIALTLIFIKFFIKGNLPSGISYLLYVIGRKDAKIKKKHTFGHIVGSALTVAFGGSVGVEGPIVLSGSAIGSRLGDLMHMDRKKRLLLIGCGSAAGISALFNAPVAGVLFTLEVILAEMKVSLLVPLLISSVTGITVSKILLDGNNEFVFTLVNKVVLSDYPVFILLGLFCGLFSVYFLRINSYFVKRTNKISGTINRWLIGGLSLGVLIALFPILFGEGYWTLNEILNGSPEKILDTTFYKDWGVSDYLLITTVFLTIILKPIATSITRFAGGIGGVFAPSLLMGGLTGFLVARVVNLFGVFKVSEQNFTLVGMAGIASGVLHSPLTSIFLIAELTKGYELFVPLMLVAAIAYGTSYVFERHSLYTKTLAERGDLVVHDKDQTVLTHIGINQVIEKDLKTVPVEGTLQDLVDVISVSKRNLFPVIDKEGRFEGIITLDDVRGIIFKPELYQEVMIKDLVHLPPSTLNYCEQMDSVMKKFDETGAWNLPVLKEGKYFGLVSKSKIFNSYRRNIKREAQM